MTIEPKFLSHGVSATFYPNRGQAKWAANSRMAHHAGVDQCVDDLLISIALIGLPLWKNMVKKHNKR